MARMLVKSLIKSSVSITMALYDIRMEEFKILLISEMQLPMMNKEELMQVLPDLNALTRTVGDWHHQSRLF